MACNNKDCVDLNSKYVRTINELEELRTMAQTVTENFDDLRRKYEDNIKQHESLQQVLQEKEENLLKMKALVEPVITEHQTLVSKYEIAKRLNTDAEIYASKLYRQNTSLKRQSQQLLDQLSHHDSLDISSLNAITEETEVANDDSSIMERHEEIVRGLEERIAQLELELKAVESGESAYAHVNKNHNKSEYEKTIEELREAVTDLSAKEQEQKQAYDNLVKQNAILREQIEKESLLKNDAINIASEWYSKCDAIKRQSHIAISAIANDEKLLKAMMEIEKITNERDNSRLEFMRQVTELEETLKDKENAENSLSQQLEQAKEENLKLLENIKTLEREKEEIRVSNIPMPPPPPPPAGIPIKLTSTIDASANDRVTKATVRKPPPSACPPGYGDALAEMMNRIKTPGGPFGRKPSLTSATKENEEMETPSEMFELRDLLAGKRSSKPFVASPAKKPEQTSPASIIHRTPDLPANGLSSPQENGSLSTSVTNLPSPKHAIQPPSPKPVVVHNPAILSPNKPEKQQQQSPTKVQIQVVGNSHSQGNSSKQQSPVTPNKPNFPSKSPSQTPAKPLSTGQPSPIHRQVGVPNTRLTPSADGTDNEPPTSIKDRIAALQNKNSQNTNSSPISKPPRSK